MHASAFGRAAKVTRGSPIELGEVLAAAHGVHEVVRDFHSSERGVERFRAQHVRSYTLDAHPLTSRQRIEVARCRSNPVTSSGKQRHEVAADVSARAHHEDVHVRSFAIRSWAPALPTVIPLSIATDSGGLLRLRCLPHAGLALFHSSPSPLWWQVSRWPCSVTARRATGASAWKMLREFDPALSHADTRLL